MIPSNPQQPHPSFVSGMPSDNIMTTAQNANALKATNNIITTNGRTLQARIDPTLPVEEVIKQLSINLKTEEAPSRFVLRDIKAQGELVTDLNLRKKIEEHADLQFELLSEEK